MSDPEICSPWRDEMAGIRGVIWGLTRGFPTAGHGFSTARKPVWAGNDL